MKLQWNLSIYCVELQLISGTRLLNLFYLHDLQIIKLNAIMVLSRFQFEHQVTFLETHCKKDNQVTVKMKIMMLIVHQVWIFCCTMKKGWSNIDSLKKYLSLKNLSLSLEFRKHCIRTMLNNIKDFLLKRKFIFLRFTLSTTEQNNKI